MEDSDEPTNPTISAQGPLESIPTRRREIEAGVFRHVECIMDKIFCSMELKNFMRFKSITFDFYPTNFMTGPASSGKSTVIMAMFLALGQDDILDSYGIQLKDCIRFGESRAIINLTVCTQHLEEGDLQDLYGYKLMITREIQLKESIWRVKSLRDNSESETVTTKDMKTNIFSQLGIGNWSSGVPFIVTPGILEIMGKRSRSYWFTEFIRLMNKLMVGEIERQSSLETELRNLNRLKKNGQSSVKKPGDLADGSTEKSVEIKRLIETKKNEVIHWTVKLERGKEICALRFEKSYEVICDSLGIHGRCFIDSENKIISFAVNNDPIPSHNECLEIWYATSSLRNRRIGLYVLIISFWMTFHNSPIYVLEGTIEDLELDKFFRSKKFEHFVTESSFDSHAQVICTAESF